MATLGEKIKFYRQQIGLTQEDVASSLGKSKNVISNWERGDNKPDADTIERLCEILNVSPNVLLNWNSSDLTKDELQLLETEKKHIKKYRLIDQIGKEAVDAVLCTEYKRYEQAKEAEAKRLAAKAAKEAKKSAYELWQSTRERRYPENVIPIDFRRDDPADDYITIPVYDQGASAGTGVFLDSSDYEMVTMPEDRMTRKANFAVWVSGNSMEPKYSDGDLVLVRTQPTVEIGEIGIFILNGDGYIKKMGHNKLISINPDYDDIEIGEWDELYCKGKVLGKA